MQKALSFLLPVAALAANIDVKVGDGGLVYSPSSITANKGDTVTFHWSSSYHSVSQSTFDKPCQYMSGGINSGVISSTTPIFVVTVTDTSPMWIYCDVGQHCQEGMSMVINQSGSDTLAEYQSAAQTAVSGTMPSSVAGGTVYANGVNSGSGSSSSSGAQSSSSSMAMSSSSSASMSSSMASTESSSMMMTTSSSGMGAASTTTGSSMSSTSTMTRSSGAAAHQAGEVLVAAGAAALAVLL